MSTLKHGFIYFIWFSGLEGKVNTISVTPSGVGIEISIYFDFFLWEAVISIKIRLFILTCNGFIAIILNELINNFEIKK